MICLNYQAKVKNW